MYSYCNFSVIKLVLAGLASIGNAFIVLTVCTIEDTRMLMVVFL